MVYPAGQHNVTPLNGTELVTVDNGGATIGYATTQQIANLAGAGTPSVITALNTVGAGTISAAAIVGKFVTRGGSQANVAFADTTTTGALLDAALADPQIGQSWEFTYQNTTNAAATLGGGVGVTVSGITVIPGGTTARYLLTRTAAATYTIVGVEQTVPSKATGTFVCNGATPVVVANTLLTANSVVVITLKTIGGTVGAVPAVTSVTPGTGFSTTGTASDTSTYNYLIIG